MSIEEALAHNAKQIHLKGADFHFSIVSLGIANELLRLGRPDLLEICVISTPVPASAILRDIL